MQSRQSKSAFLLTLTFACITAFADTSVSNSAQNNAQDNTSSPPPAKNVKLSTSIVSTTNEMQTYQNGVKINKNVLDSIPNGNGDISAALSILPNVQTNNASRTSNSPGEVNPANISISGGLPYQNSFQLDGFEMNNDIDPAGSTTNQNQRLRGGQSQGLNIDTSLLDSISVQDSNISAAYGRFSGGVIEANVRKPRTDGWHAGLSWQYTSSGMTKYHFLEGQEELANVSSNENFQPNFTKHIVRAYLEGYAAKNLGIIASFSTARSLIPLQLYSTGTDTTKQDQKRQNDNYYIKAIYNPEESFSLEANLAYMPGNNVYFIPGFKNSRYTMRSGGIQGGLKAL
ncbi:Plug domain-containing protein [Helicobacter jaachi]|uniref:Plug domain-containing protein n=1 Tax=Helicobacter jaachi TaxID=1677920 RepID=A0A4U8T9C2_9HELI|nr:Plug domain-containing protein [Helicobacter jaachi]TLD96325.1 Plug domain-containing protein [Helicobacter jaachi]